MLRFGQGKLDIGLGKPDLVDGAGREKVSCQFKLSSLMSCWFLFHGVFFKRQQCREYATVFVKSLKRILLPSLREGNKKSKRWRGG